MATAIAVDSIKIHGARIRSVANLIYSLHPSNPWWIDDDDLMGKGGDGSLQCSLFAESSRQRFHFQIKYVVWHSLIAHFQIVTMVALKAMNGFKWDFRFTGNGVVAKHEMAFPYSLIASPLKCSVQTQLGFTKAE